MHVVIDCIDYVVYTIYDVVKQFAVLSTESLVHMRNSGLSIAHVHYAARKWQWQIATSFYGFAINSAVCSGTTQFFTHLLSTTSIAKIVMKIFLLLQIAVLLLLCLGICTTEGAVPRVDLYGGLSYRAIYDPCNPSIQDYGYTLAKLRTKFHYVVYSQENYGGKSHRLTQVGVQVNVGFAVRSAHVLLPED